MPATLVLKYAAAANLLVICFTCGPRVPVRQQQYATKANKLSKQDHAVDQAALVSLSSLQGNVDSCTCNQSACAGSSTVHDYAIRTFACRLA